MVVPSPLYDDLLHPLSLSYFSQHMILLKLEEDSSSPLVAS